MGDNRIKICKYCKHKVNTEEVRRIYGSCSSVYMLSYCSASCFTKDTISDTGEKEYDTRKCDCGGRTALITGHFNYTPNDEPYNNGDEEESKVSGGDCFVGGYKCDNCMKVQGLWTE